MTAAPTAVTTAPVEPATAESTERDALPGLLDIALAALADESDQRVGPLPAGGPAAVRAACRDAFPGGALPEHGIGADGALGSLSRLLAAGAADPDDPYCIAHLHCPPLGVAVAADLLASVLNQSLDSWDQGPAAAEIEREVIDSLARLAGFDPAGAEGVLTSGGTESNLMGLLLARERTGRPGRIFCSEVAHFSIARAAGQLGLGEDAVTVVRTDGDYRIDPVALDAAITEARHRGEQPLAIVGTAGTTDLGSIDPLPALADVARAHGTWLHVDAAYGGGALFSDTLADLLTGLARADSVALDLHKLGWQPVPAGVFLARDRARFDPLARTVAYLNPADDEAAGFTSLLGRSLRTTRRADAFKVAVTMRALGRSGLGTLVDRCHALAVHAADRIAAHPRLSLVAEPVLTTVVFSAGSGEDNARVRRRLLTSGRAVIGRTELRGRTYLKLTLLNPNTTPVALDQLLELISTALDEECA